MEVYKAPEKYPNDDKFTVFFGGSIEQGKAELWGDKLAAELAKHNLDIRILNPRRDDFDSSQNNR